MVDPDTRPGHSEYWSDRNQTLRHDGDDRAWDAVALLQDPQDYSALGGPEDERIYGHTRSDNGHYPWDASGGPYDRDNLASDHDRGGYMKLHAPDYGVSRRDRVV